MPPPSIQVNQRFTPAGSAFSIPLGLGARSGLPDHSPVRHPVSYASFLSSIFQYLFLKDAQSHLTNLRHVV